MATSHLRGICFDCIDPDRVAHFWAAVLDDTLVLPPPEEPHDPSIAIHAPAGGLRIWFNKVPELKVVKNRVHLDITMPDGAELERLQRLGARILGEIRDAEERVRRTIMADLEGNECCAFPPQS